MKTFKEILPKDRLLTLVQERIKEVEAAEAYLSRLLEANAPKGGLGISSHQGGYQYYHVTGKSSAKGQYISHEKIHVAKALAKRDFARKALPLVQQNLESLLRVSRKYAPDALEKLWASLHPARRALMDPPVLSDVEYLERWNGVEYTGRSFEADATVLMTARGERVRSKSEVIIADTLYRLGVPYRYEFPYHFRRRGDAAMAPETCRSVLIFPDFTCLNVRTRREIVWEHFGLVDNKEYSQNVVDKLELYHENGFFEGENLLFTFETSVKPLSSMEVVRLAEHFLL